MNDTLLLQQQIVFTEVQNVSEYGLFEKKILKER